MPRSLAPQVLSKRRLIQLVETGLVNGWDDPRMPTISGLRRRGVPPAAIRLFVERTGVSKADNNIDYTVLEECVRETLDPQVPRAMAREVVQSGAVAERFGPDAARFGLVGDLPGAQQAEREALQMAAHCDALPEDMLPGMVMIQRLRDATLARTVVQALEDTGGPVVVITGNGHARTDWGMPALLPEGLNVVSVAQLEAAPEGPQPHDAWIVTPPVAREDPCAAFR